MSGFIVKSAGFAAINNASSALSPGAAGQYHARDRTPAVPRFFFCARPAVASTLIGAVQRIAFQNWEGALNQL
jgi:hypothetical protein